MGHVIGIDTTYTGNPVSFSTVSGGIMKSIIAPITYSQDLHGYANPWPGGGGKNKLPDLKYQYSANGVALGQDVTYTTEAITLAAGTYTLSITHTISTTPRVLYRQNGTASVLGRLTVPGTDSFTFTADGGTYSFYVYESTGVNADDITQFMLESGSTATSFEPYENNCPISGLTGLSVYVGHTQDQQGANTYNANWITQAGTAFHATIDIVKGILTIDSALKSLGDFTWQDTSGGFRTTVLGGYRAEVIACSQYEVVDYSIEFANRTDMSIQCGASDTAGQRIYIKDSRLANAEELKSVMADCQILYKIETPVTYRITPKTIEALIGQNYIWSENNETLNTVLTAPATGFAGWLIKCVTNGTPVEIPLKYMRAETYTVTPDQRMEWSAERDVTGVLHRETVQNLPPKIEFNTPLMTNSDINALNSIIKAAFTNYLQRNITIQFYDPERDEYWEWDCYMPDVKYHIRNADTANSIVNYEELRYAFIGY